MVRVRQSRPPYELYGIPRERVEKDYPTWVKSGWIAEASVEGELVRETLHGFGFALEPKSGWPKIGYEVRLIELSMTGKWPEEKGSAQQSRDCAKLAEEVKRMAFALSKLSGSQNIFTASCIIDAQFTEHLTGFFKTASDLEKVAAYLRENKQSAKWASAQRREARLILACKLAPVFEAEFAKPAKPRGGSEALPRIEDEAEWTQFYQGIAKLFFDEVESPDRQGILWEAARQSDIGPSTE